MQRHRPSCAVQLLPLLLPPLVRCVSAGIISSARCTPLGAAFVHRPVAQCPWASAGAEAGHKLRLSLAAKARSRHVLLSASEADAWMTYAALAASAAAGQHLGCATRLGKALSAPICAMLCTFCTASFGVLPPASATVKVAQGMAVRLATPLLLFGADLRQVARRASRLLPAFALAVLSTMVGSWCGVRLLRAPMESALGGEALKAAAALAAKNIGGGLNFVAVAAALKLDPTAMAIALTADNILALIYFPICSALGRGQPDPLAPMAVGRDVQADERTSASRLPPPGTGEVNCFSQTAALALALALVALSLRVAPDGLDIPFATVAMVAVATALPGPVSKLLPAAEQLGTLFLFIFFASAGWTGGALGVSTLVGGGVPLLAFLLVLYLVHAVVIWGAVALLKTASTEAATSLFPRATLLTASNACIGGPATASALAVGNGWPSLVVPCVLVGNLGYAIATFLGILLHRSFCRFS